METSNNIPSPSSSSSSSSPPCSSRVYIAVRNGHYGIQNCIFVNWEDAAHVLHVRDVSPDEKKNDGADGGGGAVEYQSFSTVVEAETYLSSSKKNYHPTSNQNDGTTLMEEKKLETAPAGEGESSTIKVRTPTAVPVVETEVMGHTPKSDSEQPDPVLAAISTSIQKSTRKSIATTNTFAAATATATAPSSSVGAARKPTQDATTARSHPATTGPRRRRISKLYHALLESKKNINPFAYYDVVKVIGDGSMGSVSKVTRRKSRTSSRSHTRNSSRSSSLTTRNSSTMISTLTIEETEASFNTSGITTNGDDDNDTPSGSDENKHDTNSGSEEENEADDDEDDDDYDDTGSVINRQTKRIEDEDRRLPQKPYALKSLVIDRVSDPTFIQELQNEIDILRKLDHPNICKALETYDYEQRLYLVLELCSGGDLYSRDPYEEMEAKVIVQSILEAVYYLHRKNITHRDLKYENIMFASPTSPTVKIIDFGLSKKYGNDEVLKKTCGTIHTMAPEVLRGVGYDHKCDVWSIGILSYMLCSSALPFFGRNNQVLASNIIRGHFAFKGPRWKTLSKDAKDFVRSLLVTDVNQRLDCEAALQHTWLQHTDDDDHDDGDWDDNGINGQRVRHKSNSLLCARQVVSSVVMDRVQATIQMYSTYPGFKKLALYIIAHKSTADEIGFLQQLFLDRFDTSRDGIISYEEFKDALAVYSYTDDELEAMFTAIDIDNCNRISYLEFLAATIEARGTIDEERILETFERLDSNDSGYITTLDLEVFAGDRLNANMREILIGHVDSNHDGRIDYEEFKGMFTTTEDDFHERFQQSLKDVRKKRIKRESYCNCNSRDEVDEEETTSQYNEDDDDACDYFALKKVQSMRAVCI